MTTGGVPNVIVHELGTVGGQHIILKGYTSTERFQIARLGYVPWLCATCLLVESGWEMEMIAPCKPRSGQTAETPSLMMCEMRRLPDTALQMGSGKRVCRP